jgi:rare lipoprotein A
MTKEKESLRPPSLQASDNAAPEQRSKGMEALQANHERPANPHERALPFSTVHPYGPPCESRAEAPGPTCLRSIARNRGAMAREIVISCTLLVGDSQPLRTISPNKCSKLFFFLLSLPLVLFAPAAVEAKSSCAHASFYGVGDGFHGLRAADGSRFDAHGLTTAHKTLPFGTRLRVTNPANNRSVTVTVTDRGPFIAGRSLDLSYGAFSRIASPGQGVARVCFARL